MHALQGEWKIVAKTPFGVMNMVATMNVSEDEKTFQGTVLEEKSNKTYPLENGVLEGNTIKYEIAMKFGLIPMRFKLEGTFNPEDWTCQGVARAMKIEAGYTGYKIIK